MIAFNIFNSARGRNKGGYEQETMWPFNLFNMAGGKKKRVGYEQETSEPIDKFNVAKGRERRREDTRIREDTSRKQLSLLTFLTWLGAKKNSGVDTSRK